MSEIKIKFQCIANYDDSPVPDVIQEFDSYEQAEAWLEQGEYEATFWTIRKVFLRKCDEPE